MSKLEVLANAEENLGEARQLLLEIKLHRSSPPAKWPELAERIRRVDAHAKSDQGS